MRHLELGPYGNGSESPAVVDTLRIHLLTRVARSHKEDVVWAGSDFILKFCVCVCVGLAWLYLHHHWLAVLIPHLPDV